MGLHMEWPLRAGRRLVGQTHGLMSGVRLGGGPVGGDERTYESVVCVQLLAVGDQEFYLVVSVPRRLLGGDCQ